MIPGVSRLDLPDVRISLTTIGCGCTDPDPKVEAKAAAARATLAIPSGFNGCGRLVVVWQAYRCLECGRWMHADCLRRHFHESQHDREAAR